MGEVIKDEGPDIETINHVMLLSFEHHQLHREILLQKLRHAKEATGQGLRVIESFSAIDHGQPIREFREIEDYEALWDSAIALFEDSFVPDDALEKIENLLSTIPFLIKKYYDVFVEHDIVLQQMIKQARAQKYAGALRCIKEIQNRPCLMSGLDPKEFTSALKISMERSLKFMPPVIRS